MNQKLILRIVGLILCIEALCMLPSLLLAAASGGEDLQAFFVSAVLCGGIGGLLALIKPDDSRLQTRDGFVCVALCWIVLLSSSLYTVRKLSLFIAFTCT